MKQAKKQNGRIKKKDMTIAEELLVATAVPPAIKAALPHLALLLLRPHLAIRFIHNPVDVRLKLAHVGVDYP